MTASQGPCTNRLWLRPFQISDLSSLISICSDTEVMQFVGEGPLTPEETRQQLEHWISDYQRDGFGFMAFVDRTTGTLIGYGGFLHQIINGETKIELGYVIAKPYWKQGFASEATRALKDYGLNQLKFHELISIIHEGNRASQKIALKLGMVLADQTTIDGKSCLIYRCQRPTFTFALADVSQKPLIVDWLDQEHVRKWFHGVGLKNTLEDLDKFFKGTSLFQHWIGYDQGIPFAFLSTSYEGADAITLDLFIGDLRFLGKGLSAPLIREFLLSQFSHKKQVLIDPEITNTIAVHVYQKVGFKIIGEFIASWHPIPHYKMSLNMKDLRGKGLYGTGLT